MASSDNLAPEVEEGHWLKVRSLSFLSSFRIRDNDIERIVYTWCAVFPFICTMFGLKPTLLGVMNLKFQASPSWYVPSHPLDGRIFT